MTRRPESDEYAAYFDRYISLVPGGDIVATIGAQLDDTFAVLRGLSDERGRYAYAPGKWSMKEVVGHLIDTERIMAYRALRIARGDVTPLAGFEQDAYVAQARFNDRSLVELQDEWTCVRASNVALFGSWHEDDWMRRGTASNNPISARALVYIIAGHELYHRDILETRYLREA